VIPASGYYEWKATPTGKQPYYISAADDSMLSLAGLWDEWQNIESGEIVKSCTIIITDANDFTRKIHNRMPVILNTKQLPQWLVGKAGEELLKPAPENILRTWPVSRKVNRVGNDNDPKLIEPLQ